MLRAGVIIVYYIIVSVCVRELFTIVIAECANRCVRGDSLLLESVLLTSVQYMYTNCIILL